jgi:hypothetical protein
VNDPAPNGASAKDVPSPEAQRSSTKQPNIEPFTTGLIIPMKIDSPSMADAIAIVD